MPPVEAGVGEVLLGGDGGGVEGAVVRVAELDVGQPFVGRDEAVADYLDLRLVGDGLEIGVEDGFGSDRGFAAIVAVAVERRGERVETLGELVLRARGDVGLGLDDEDLVGEEGAAEDGKVGVCLSSRRPLVSIASNEMGSNSANEKTVGLKLMVPYRGGYRF